MATEAIETGLQVSKVTVFASLLPPQEVTPEALTQAQPQIETLAQDFFQGLGPYREEGRSWVSAWERAKTEMVRKGGKEGTTEEIQPVFEEVFQTTRDFALTGLALTVTRRGGENPLKQWPFSSLLPLAELGVCRLELSSGGKLTESKLNLEFTLEGGEKSSLGISPKIRESVSTLNQIKRPTFPQEPGPVGGR